MEVVIPQSPKTFGGYFKMLDVAKTASQAYGNTVTVMDAFPSAAVDEFRKHYRHKSTNPEHFERWGFEQWILLAEWMKATGRKMVFKIDSDCLVFSDLEKDWEALGKPVYAGPVSTPFISLETAKAIAEYILDSFRTGKEVERCSDKKHVCDYSLIGPTAGALGLVDVGPLAIIDSNLFVFEGGRMRSGHKDICFRNGVPVYPHPFIDKRMIMLHCWGRAKDKMDKIWEQSRRSIGGDPVWLSLD